MSQNPKSWKFQILHFAYLVGISSKLMFPIMLWGVVRSQTWSFHDFPARSTNSMSWLSVLGPHWFAPEIVDFEWFLEHRKTRVWKLQASILTPGRSPWVSDTIIIFFMVCSKRNIFIIFFRLSHTRFVKNDRIFHQAEGKKCLKTRMWWGRDEQKYKKYFASNKP